MRWACPPGNDDLLDAINGAIARIKASAGYGDLVRRYLSYKSEDVVKPVAGRKTYTVRPGETLSTIARDRLGSVRALGGDLADQPGAHREPAPDLSGLRFDHAMTVPTPTGGSSRCSRGL